MALTPMKSQSHAGPYAQTKDEDEDPQHAKEQERETESVRVPASSGWLDAATSARCSQIANPMSASPRTITCDGEIGSRTTWAKGKRRQTSQACWYSRQSRNVTPLEAIPSSERAVPPGEVQRTSCSGVLRC